MKQPRLRRHDSNRRRVGTTASAGDRQRAESVGAFTCYVLVGGLFVVAALLKTHQLATSPSDSNYLFGSWLLTILLVQSEVLMGGWLLSGLAPKPARRAAILVLCLFAMVSFYKGLTEEAVCGLPD